MKIKTKKMICLIIGCIALFAAFGFIGGMERFYIEVAAGIRNIIICLVVAFAAFWKAGVFKR